MLLDTSHNSIYIVIINIKTEYLIKYYDITVLELMFKKNIHIPKKNNPHLI